MRVAAVDIGTNTVRLLVADRNGVGSPLTWVQRLTTVTRLGEGVDTERRLRSAAISRTVAALRDYREVIAAERPDRIRAVATSAVRDAADRAVFLDAAAAALGTRPVLITGDEEALLSFRGATSELRGDEPFLVIDPGGGSTEFVLGAGDPVYAISVDTGSVRITDRHLPAQPAAVGAVASARADVDRLLEGVRLPAAPGTVAGVGGTFTSLAAILLGLAEYDARLVHGARLAAKAFGGLVEPLAGLSLVEIEQIPSLDPARAPVLLGGAIVVARALAHVEAAEVVVSEADILDGVALELGEG